VAAIAKPEPEIPVWARMAADWIGFLPMGKAAAWMGKKAGQTKSAATKGKPACASKTQWVTRSMWQPANSSIGARPFTYLPHILNLR